MNHAEKLELIVRLRDKQQRLAAKMKRVKRYPAPGSINVYRRRVKVVLEIVMQYQEISAKIAKLVTTPVPKRARGGLFKDGFAVVMDGGAGVLQPRGKRSKRNINQ